MKNLITTLSAVLFTVTLMAQMPQTFNYQAVLRDASYNIRANTNVSIAISILQDSVTGTTVYSETHDTTTNSLGLVNLEIGSINPSGFSSIDWSKGPYFVKISVDGIEMGISQLLSVPYALYAKNAGSSQWRNYLNHIYYNTGRVGINNSNPATLLDIGSGNNWDLTNTEGDMRIGNTNYRLKFGVAVEGSGAGASSIMQYGSPAGYNVLNLGAQGKNILSLNGNTNRVGMGTDSPSGRLEIKSGGGINEPQQVLNQTGMGEYSRLRYMNGNSSANNRYWDISGYIAGGTGTNGSDQLNIYNSTQGDILLLKGNGAVGFNGNYGSPNNIPVSGGPDGQTQWKAPNEIIRTLSNANYQSSVVFTSTITSFIFNNHTYTFTLNQDTKVLVSYTAAIRSLGCVACSNSEDNMEVLLDGTTVYQGSTIKTANYLTSSGSLANMGLDVSAGEHTIEFKGIHGSGSGTNSFIILNSTTLMLIPK